MLGQWLTVDSTSGFDKQQDATARISGKPPFVPGFFIAVCAISVARSVARFRRHHQGRASRCSESRAVSRLRPRFIWPLLQATCSNLSLQLPSECPLNRLNPRVQSTNTGPCLRSRRQITPQLGRHTGTTCTMLFSRTQRVTVIRVGTSSPTWRVGQGRPPQSSRNCSRRQ